MELHFTVTFMLIRKTWDSQFVSWRMEDFKKWGDPSNGGVDTTLGL